MWHNIFGKKVKQSDLFVELLCFCLLKVWNIFFVFRRWCVNEFPFQWQLRYFHGKISLVFVVFFHFFMVFLCFLAAFFKFSRVVQSNSYLAKTATNVFLNFIVLLCPFTFCFQSVFSPLFSRCFFLHYIIIFLYKNYAKCSHIGVSFPGNRRQKDSVHCCVIMHAQ